jgi:hypothetical protein
MTRADVESQAEAKLGFTGHTAVVIGEDFASVLARAQQGDEAAFARLWRDLNPALLRYLGLSGKAAELSSATASSTAATCRPSTSHSTALSSGTTGGAGSDRVS